MTEFDRLRDVVRRLRAPDGCSWDRDQTNPSLAPAIIEEAYEVADAIRAGDDVNLCEELGDLLMVILMHAQIAEGAGRFTIEEALRGVTDKLVRRHPHVFGTSDARDSGAVLKQWDAIKRDEKKNPDTHYLADIPMSLPALMRAQKVQTKAARVNFDWTNIADVVAKVDEELAEVKEAMRASDTDAVADEIGDLLFAVTNLARKSELAAEMVLQAATDKFIQRFDELEDRVRQNGDKLGTLDLGQLDEIWDALKRDRARITQATPSQP
ncbi:MAG: nucleoside triphosphate pyrophosphohydrolase [Verrucomicrobiota bacterium]|nr:nucleoside triphosphate pyrophosphohydrolase [Verrucomicrobiota bacterium]